MHLSFKISTPDSPLFTCILDISGSPGYEGLGVLACRGRSGILTFSFSNPGFVSHVDHWIPGNATDATTSLLVRKKKHTHNAGTTSHTGLP